ncbi:hypothetical protein LZ30DRAFT_684879 [Colletotrichum cereale]|nr:hypothetical protein LZ30DRAFT_684879 [Colletotrichum cereale]
MSLVTPDSSQADPVNRQGKSISASSRAESKWFNLELVFQDGWDTNTPFLEPGPIPPRTASASSIQIGVLSRNADVSKKRRADGTTVNTKAWRSAGAPVFMKVNTIWEQRDMTFPFCDSRGGGFAANIQFTWNPGFTFAGAKGMCTGNWDAAELRRVGRVNTDWVVYWVRNRLLANLRDGTSRDPESTSALEGSGKAGQVSQIVHVCRQPQPI